MPDLKPKPDNTPNKWALVSLATEMGFIIALPLLVFALGGKWLDARMHNSTPWFTLLGILLAITSTTIWLTRKIKDLIK
ncbi:MAG: AtpZ/AtpI family protein [Candidatus Doudnabacteria bacterium]